MQQSKKFCIIVNNEQVYNKFIFNVYKFFQLGILLITLLIMISLLSIYFYIKNHDNFVNKNAKLYLNNQNLFPVLYEVNIEKILHLDNSNKFKNTN